MASLPEIRDKGSFTARYSSKGALLNEQFTIINAIKEGTSVEDLRDKIKKREILTHRSYSNRITVWNHLNRRCFSLGDWVINSFIKASDAGPDSTEFRSLAYLYYVIRDRLTYSIVTDLVWEFWNNKRVNIEANDILEKIYEYSEKHEAISSWKESTTQKLSRSIIAALRDYGLLSGKNTKYIQQMSVSDETILHLLCIQIAEGLRGSKIIDSIDWRIFLWDRNTVSHNLSRLAMLGWIGFEKSGDTVMIELKRKPGVDIE